MKILFLDDSGYRHKEFRQNSIGNPVMHVWNAEQCIHCLGHESYDMIFLDHDLDETKQGLILDGERDGRYVCRELVKFPSIDRQTPIIIHSLNYPAAEQMRDILGEAGFTKVLRVPFAWELFDGTLETLEVRAGQIDKY